MARAAWDRGVRGKAGRRRRPASTGGNSRKAASRATARYFRGLPEKGEAAAKYREVYRNYEKQARHSLNKEEIPLGYREYIRKYFDSVRPKENE
jgi:hypothetical protein